jgi:hypothetical protein
MNFAYPAAKGHIGYLSGSLRNFQKLVSQRNDPGKELEYRKILNLLNDQLVILVPEMFNIYTLED